MITKALLLDSIVVLNFLGVTIFSVCYAFGYIYTAFIMTEKMFEIFGC